MARPAEDRTKLRAAYVHDRLPLEMAAAKADVPIGTARRWRSDAEKDGDDWDRARAAHSLSATGTGAVAQMVLAKFVTLYLATVEEIEASSADPLDKAKALASLADAFTKTMAAVAKAAPDLGRYAIATELLRDFAAFIDRDFPEHRAAFVEVLPVFGACIAKKYG